MLQHGTYIMSCSWLESGKLNWGIFLLQLARESLYQGHTQGNGKAVLEQEEVSGKYESPILITYCYT